MYMTWCVPGFMYMTWCVPGFLTGRVEKDNLKSHLVEYWIHETTNRFFALKSMQNPACCALCIAQRFPLYMCRL